MRSYLDNLMVVATCVMTLQLEAVFSLKDKRRIIKSIITRLPQKFNVAVAEVDAHDVWQTAVIAIVTVGTDSAFVHGRLEKAVAWVAETRPDAPIADYSIEMW